MSPIKKIIAICGSTRHTSSNLGLINAIQRLYANQLEFDYFLEIGTLPHFNPDLDTQDPPIEIVGFRRRLAQSDGILICTPEYAMGVPGSLKNALDWTVSSMEFSHKPVALITASSSGQKGHAALLETLLVIESNIPESSRLLISFIKTKVKEDTIIDPTTLAQVKAVIDSLLETMQQSS